MKRFIIPIIALVVICIGSLTAFFIVQNKQNEIAHESKLREDDYALFTFNSESINKVTFEFDGQTYVAELDSADSEWHFTSDTEFEVRHSYVQNVCTYMCNLTAVKDYGEANEENKKAYSLDNPVVITASNGSDEYKIYVGGSSPTGEFYYVMTGNRDKIYAIDSLYGTVLRTTRDLLKDRYLIPYSDAEIANIKIRTTNDETLEFSSNPEDGTWLIPDKFNGLTVSNTSVSSMVTVMIRLEAQNFFEENLTDYSLYGFDNPDGELTVTGKDGTSVKRLFSYNGEKNPENIYVLFEESGQVASYNAFDCDFIEDTYIEFLLEYFCNFNRSTTTGFDFTFGDASESFTFDSETDTVKRGDVSVNEKGDTAFTAFEHFFDSLCYMEIVKLDVEASPDTSADAVLSVNFHKTDGTDMLVELYEADDKFLYVAINGEYSGALLDKTHVFGINSVDSFYTAFTEAMA